MPTEKDEPMDLRSGAPMPRRKTAKDVLNVGPSPPIIIREQPHPGFWAKVWRAMKGVFR